jgi:hypothetical protein
LIFIFIFVTVSFFKLKIVDLKMVIFIIINDISGIDSSPEWIDSPSFKNKFVNKNGKTVAENYEGHRYQLIGKQ